MKRTGVFGGTFDPVHIGHLAAAQAALETLGLDRVVFVPAGRPPHKLGRRLSESRHRLAMVRLAIKGNSRFAASASEIVSPGPSFTVNTLERIASDGKGQRLHLLIGTDQAQQLDTWMNPERIFSLAEVDVLARPGYQANMIPGRWRDLVRTVEIPRLEVSSSLIRGLASKGRSVAYLVPAPVAAYIARHGLYRGGKPKNTGRHGI